ncbi:MAG: biopolymer transporter ExbD [Robiginitomaculum sp.]|nr:biopolymer transporter ExbD [Robiginitomaculum sp.]
MSRRSHKKPVDDSDIDMTPMLDIVFIMLIFFIVTATFLDEKGIDLTQPPPPPDSLDNPEPKPAIIVFIDARNQCSVDGNSAECDRVTLVVEGTLGEKPGANIILRVSELAKHGNLVSLKDSFDQKGLPSKIEIIPAS